MVRSTVGGWLIWCERGRASGFVPSQLESAERRRRLLMRSRLQKANAMAQQLHRHARPPSLLAAHPLTSSPARAQLAEQQGPSHKRLETERARKKKQKRSQKRCCTAAAAAAGEPRRPGSGRWPSGPGEPASRAAAPLCRPECSVRFLLSMMRGKKPFPFGVWTTDARAPPPSLVSPARAARAQHRRSEVAGCSRPLALLVAAQTGRNKNFAARPTLGRSLALADAKTLSFTALPTPKKQSTGGDNDVLECPTLRDKLTPR